MRKKTTDENEIKLRKERKAKYDSDYAKKYLHRILVTFQNSEYEKIKAAALRSGDTVNGYIKKAIKMRMDSES